MLDKCVTTGLLDNPSRTGDPISNMADIVNRLGRKIEQWSQDIEDSSDAEEMAADRLLLGQLRLTECLCRAITKEEAAGGGLSVLLEYTDFDRGGVYFIHDNRLRLIASSGLSDEFLAAVRELPPDSEQWEFIKGGPYFGEYPPDGIKGIDRARQNAGLVGFCTIPLYFRDNLIGCINMASDKLAIVEAKSRAAIVTASSHIGEVIGRIALTEEQHAQKLQFMAICEAADEAIAIFNSGSIVVANRAFGELVGVPVDALPGMHKSVILNHEDLEIYFSLKKTLSVEELAQPMNMRVKNITTGEYANAVVRFKNLHKLNGYSDCVVMVAHEWQARK